MTAFHDMQEEKDVFEEGDSTPLSNFADMHSPCTYISVGSAISNYVAPEAGPTQRENAEEACMEFGHALPPIKSNSYNTSMFSNKLPNANTSSKSSQRLQTPKVYIVAYVTMYISIQTSSLICYIKI